MTQPGIEKRPLVLIAGASAAALALLVWLIYFNEQAFFDPQTVAFLPAVNAALNSASALFLVLAIVAIKGGRRDAHGRYMGTAFGFSALFLVS
ncbi:unnamed protein product, partial [Laminaria digitata]